MQIELFLQRLGILGRFGFPGREVGFGQFKDPEAAILVCPLALWKRVGVRG